jgi:DNA-binding transcriptional ArsR family regulator
MPAAAIAILERWVSMGAPDPRLAASAAAPEGLPEPSRDHWAFQPLATAPANASIDSFIQSALASAGLQPLPAADRPTLLRRVTFDLTGLPPTPEQLSDFLADDSQDAWARVIDRLLASPAYGQRWGRHWLDVARYADSNGLDENVAIGSAWRYRDYVVSAFNEDLPFDQFLTEQVAGDLLDHPDQETRARRATATAFLNLGAKVLAEPDKEKLQMDIIDEQIDTIGKVFLGMTLGCARCHDHKFDPVSQADYFSLAAIFKSTRSLSEGRTGALSHWYEHGIGDFEQFAAAHATEGRLSEIKKRLSSAESEARKELTTQARENAASYLAAALELPDHPTLTQAGVVAKKRPGLHGAILLNCRVFLRTNEEDEFFSVWRAALRSGDAETVRRHYQPLFEAGLAPAAKDSGEEQDEVARARLLLNDAKGFLALPAVPDPLYPAETLAQIHALRDEADAVEKSLPDLPTVIGVADSDTVVDRMPIHIRGNHQTPGKEVSRGFPDVIQASLRSAGAASRHDSLPAGSSGRLELARWLTDPAHPLTARVIVNRVWTWHFGQGIARTPDNFGALGEPPTHPELLDWLARWFMDSGWSVKKLHRLILSSAAYQRASAAQSPDSDPDNRLLSHFPIRRLEAEEIRDAILITAGLLDPLPGGKTVPLRNRQFVFNHTSQDATRYDSTRRAIYLPVIRNHLYDMFQQFDYPDPATPTGLRNSSVVAPQALFLMNSPLVTEAAAALAGSLASSITATRAQLLESLFVRLFARHPSTGEIAALENHLRVLESSAASTSGPAQNADQAALARLAHVLFMSNEFVYLR